MSTQVSNKRRAYSSTTGRVAEVRFQRAARNKGLFVRKASPNEDMHNHIDYWVALKSGQKWGVDVKGNNLPDEIWCEFKNVLGNPGWMYGGADYIAFDMPEEGGFSIVRREELAFFCEKHVSKEIVEDKKSAYLKRNSKKDRQDVITRLRPRDIQSMLSYRVWEYDKSY